MRSQPLICVRDVEASSRWYQRLLGCQGAHGGKEYERLVSYGRLVLQLHRWDVEHHHGPIGDPNLKPYGNGVLLWFEIEDFDAAAARAGVCLCGSHKLLVSLLDRNRPALLVTEIDRCNRALMHRRNT